MGEGKSKAALWAGHGLIRSRQARGLYFAMPTQVTSERVWEEAMRPFVENSFEWSEGTPESVRLIHSASWLRMMDDPDWNQNRPDDGGRDARDWFHGNKRALLAPFGVGTIDQALLGVLAKKHFFVRIAALSGKVVVLDEIHSYDLYTGTGTDWSWTWLGAVTSYDDWPVLDHEMSLSRAAIGDPVSFDFIAITDFWTGDNYPDGARGGTTGDCFTYTTVPEPAAAALAALALLTAGRRRRR